MARQAGRWHGAPAGGARSPLPPLQCRLHCSHTDRAPFPTPALPQGLGPPFRFPASTHNEAGTPTFFTWQNASSPRHLQRASSHTFHLFNFTVSVETAALGPQAEGPLPSLGPQHSSRCPRRPERRLRGCGGSVQPGPILPSPHALPRASRCPDPAEGAHVQEKHSRLQLGRLLQVN